MEPIKQRPVAPPLNVTDGVMHPTLQRQLELFSEQISQRHLLSHSAQISQLLLKDEITMVVVNDGDSIGKVGVGIVDGALGTNRLNINQSPLGIIPEADVVGVDRLNLILDTRLGNETGQGSATIGTAAQANHVVDYILISQLPGMMSIEINLQFLASAKVKSC